MQSFGLLGKGTKVIARGGYFVGEKNGVGFPFTPARGCHVKPFGGLRSVIKHPVGGSRRAGALRPMSRLIAGAVVVVRATRDGISWPAYVGLTGVASPSICNAIPLKSTSSSNARRFCSCIWKQREEFPYLTDYEKIMFGSLKCVFVGE